ncbi:MAG: endo-1,4-beta-xylanase [Verrucomicrobiae bacterium]|nr:endo-1,4-beta-xylanase [Verrucomicrobiae bacterium]
MQPWHCNFVQAAVVLAGLSLSPAPLLAQTSPPLAEDEVRLLAETDARIQKARTAPLQIKVVNAQGKPLARTEVKVEHLRHDFYFGAGFDPRLRERPDETEVDRRHREHFLRLFNYATVHLYWGGYEPQKGQPQSAVRLQYIQWLKEKGLTPRGHPVFWNQDNVLPRWMMQDQPEPAAMRALMDERLREMSATVLPALADADIFNEVVQWERFTNNPMTRLMQAEGKVALVAHYLKEARRLNPQLKLVVNDYDRSAAFTRFVGELIKAGAPVDIIGQQSHMHDGPWTVRQTWEIVERHSTLGRPVLFTELSVLSGPRRKIDWRSRATDWHTDPENEAVQANYLEQFYRLLFSHSNCIGIVVWNYSDRGAWLGAPVGLLRPDGTPKPAYEKLDHLINHQWRTRGTFTTDPEGRLTLPAAYAGEYRLTVGGRVTNAWHRVAQPLQITLRQ